MKLRPAIRDQCFALIVMLFFSTNVFAAKSQGLEPGLGLSSIRVQDGRGTTYSTTTITPKLGYSTELSKRNKRWRGHASLYYTAHQLSKSSEATVAFLGINARAGYQLISTRSKSGLFLYGGWFYTTMFVSTNSFGYEHLNGPQLYPVIQLNFKKGFTGYLYGKFSPITSSIDSISMKNNEKAFGAGFGIPTKRGRTDGRKFYVTVDYSQVKVVLDKVPISTRSITAGISFGF